MSDLLFCLAVIPHAWVDKIGFMFECRGFDLYYTLYGDAIVNSLITSSTWLTVAMATSRYLAVVHPLKARYIIGMTFAKVSIFPIIQMCISSMQDSGFAWRIQNLPRTGAKPHRTGRQCPMRDYSEHVKIFGPRRGDIRQR